VVGAAPPGGGRGQIQGLLATARGYAVFDRDWKRVGVFVELAGPGSDEIAIRHDGVFLWRRRVLPITSVSRVLSDRRAIELNVDRRSLANSHVGTSATGESIASEESPGSAEDMQARIARYISPALRVEPRGEQRVSRHLLFVSGSHGYTLVEVAGPPPFVGEEIDVPEHRGSFRVAKLGSSPLPNDPRVCAYLE
jgi:hypothetical protein